ncbi:caspase family protein [Roseibium aggregatum]|uniref:Caspase family protein n=1 Tax=Roseibium aggregatum TaxID=187304 RepID=A0A939EAK6_9HYPH|nr:caspase family protein [Roseibium aggregatum]MBN9669216.1 caspase family protein [Roseibium aggregatum]
MNQRGACSTHYLRVSVFCALLLVTLASMALVEARAAVMPGGNSGWLVVASRPDPNAAITVARNFANRFPQTTVFQSNNGWYAVTLGWMPQPAGNAYKSRLLSSGAIPGDSYFHNGERFQTAIWSATGATGGASQSLFAVTAISDTAGSAPRLPDTRQSASQGYVTNLDPRGDNYLSLRTGPSSRYREIARMGPNTRLTILGRNGSWLNVALSDGRSGWAHSRYVATLPDFASPAPPSVTPPPVFSPSPPVTSQPPATAPTSAKRSITPPRAGVVGDLSGSGDDFLALRSGAGTNHGEIARLLEGTDVTMLAQQGAWFEIELSNGMRGWAYGRYLEAAKAVSPGGQSVGKDQAATPPQTSPNLPDLTALPQGKRVALVIGNSAYENTTPLPNPKNDATRLMESLKRLGFTVVLGLDQSKAAMESTVRSFVRNIQDADVALFFYAGHAMQLDGRNFLIPTDARLEDATAVDFETIELATILNYMNAPGRLSIALLDACRDNPLSRRFRNFTRSSAGRGLAAPQAGDGNILIGYATAPGEVALDGEGDNSPFTEALLKHIETPDLEIEIMMKRVKADVYSTTRGSQSPWHNSALRREFYFLKKGS